MLDKHVSSTVSQNQSLMYARRGFFATCMGAYCCEYIVELDAPKYTLEYWMLNIGGCEVQLAELDERGGHNTGKQLLSLVCLASFPVSGDRSRLGHHIQSNSAGFCVP